MQTENKTTNDVHTLQRRPTILVAVAVVYAAWLLWLAYVAWVNVSAGNQ